MLSQALGGIGLFLIGMLLVTDGLRSAAGDSLRTLLLRFTGGPLKAMASGALITAVVQSSSVTTLATIGFVGAGLITFHQSLGVIFGANLGTTATGWIVATVGLKFSVSAVALPLVGVGALVRLLGRGRMAHAGAALAGFGTLFVGIDFLQSGMAGVSQHITPESLPAATILGRIALVGIGFLLTAIMQSSSAAVATTLAALHAGSVNIEQAAAMVIGVNVGTTVTAGLAAIGASLAAKRASLAHFFFNAITGVIALAALPLFIALVERIDGSGPDRLTAQLAAFHTAFNVAGVCLLMPISRRFSGLVERMLPEKRSVLTRFLDKHTTGLGSLAVEVVRRTVEEIASMVVLALRDVLREERLSQTSADRLEEAARALAYCRDYMRRLHGHDLGHTEHDRHVSTVHALEYLGRLIDNTLEGEQKKFGASEQGRSIRDRLLRDLEAIRAWLGESQREAPVETARHLTATIADIRKRHRPDILERTARGEIGADEAERELEAIRWLDEIGFYLHRITEHLSGERLLEPVPKATST